MKLYFTVRRRQGASWPCSYHTALAGAPRLYTQPTEPERQAENMGRCPDWGQWSEQHVALTQGGSAWALCRHTAIAADKKSHGLPHWALHPGWVAGLRIPSPVLLQLGPHHSTTSCWCPSQKQWLRAPASLVLFSACLVQELLLVAEAVPGFPWALLRSVVMCY